jgi:hypothetical protein
MSKNRLGGAGIASLRDDSGVGTAENDRLSATGSGENYVR